MKNFGDARQTIITPDMLPQQRRLTGGKHLDGSFFIEIEGAGQVRLAPQQAIDFAVGMLRGLGINIEFGSGPRQ